MNTNVRGKRRKKGLGESRRADERLMSKESYVWNKKTRERVQRQERVKNKRSGEKYKRKGDKYM